MPHHRFFQYWEKIFAQSPVTLYYVSLLPILYFFNSSHGPLKGFLIGCSFFTLGLSIKGSLSPLSKIIWVAWASLAYTFGVVLYSFAGDYLQDREVLRLSYKLLFLGSFIGVAYHAFRTYGVEKFLLTLKICALIGGIISVSLYGLKSFSQYVDRLLPIGLLNHPILGSSVYGMVGVIGFFGIFTAQKPREYLFNGGLFILCILVVFLSQSRGPLMALGLTIIFTLAYFMLFERHFLSRNMHLFLWGIGGGIMLILFLINYTSNSFFWTTLWARGDSSRLLIWQETGKRIMATFPWGAGYKEVMTIQLAENSSVNHPHNLFLSKVYREGLAGLVLLLVLMGMVGIKIKRVWRTPQGGLAAMLFIHGVLSCLTDTSSLWDGKNFEMLLFFWTPVVFLASIKEE